LAHAFPIPYGRYQLVERLAVGGMAELFLASASGEHGFAKTLVIKRLLPHLAREAAYNAMFIDEAKLTARLVHPKIAQTYELGRVGESLFIAMEYVDGIDVLAMLRELAYRRQRVPVEIAVWIAHEVLDALEFAHNLADEQGRPLGVVHRDISPSNVLLSRRGDVKLVDFGIARASAAGRAHQTKSGTLKGKYGYMSPEQVVELPVDARSDLFSVGIVLAEMLCGRRLFAAANELDVLLMVRDARLTRLDKFGADIEPGLDVILRKALKKGIDERWSTAAQFRDALSEWMFDQRLRVTPRHVAEVVESLQEAAAMRRRESLTAAADAASAVLEQADVEARVLGAVRTSPAAPSPLTPPAPAPSLSAAGPPRPGTEDDRDSAPLISVEPYEPSVHTEPTSPGRKAPRELKATTPVPVRAPGAPGDPLAELRLELEAELPGGGARPPPHGAATQQAVRYPSIEAAINALSPLGPDPSAEDFDGKAESGARPRDAVMPAPEAVAAAPPPPPPVIGEIATPADDTGDFAATPALTVLFRLMTSRATGLLVCSIGGIKKEIYVRDGMPEYVSSNVASELFGNYLVGQGILSEGELAMALAMMPHYGGKLGDTLVGLGLLRPLEVFRHLTRQVRAKLVDVCTWGKGSFGWYAGRENPREAFPLDLNGFEVLGAGAMAMSDDAVDAWALRQRGTRLKAVKSGRIGPQRFELGGLRELHERLDGRKSVGDLLDVYTDAIERRRTGRLLILLQQTELAKQA
jgi:serine/threonine protein kinase